MEDVFAAFSEAKIIAYIRDPLDALESVYNQGVKRHYQTRRLIISDSPKTPSLDLLVKQVKEFGSDAFIIRPYDFKLFEGGNIVTDFLSVLGVRHLKRVESGVINSSYVFEALEFKRWMNQFKHADLHSLLDSFLQNYSDGTKTFSLLEEQKRITIRQFFSQKLEALSRDVPIQNGQAFISALNHKALKPYKKQEITEDIFMSMLIALIDSDKEVVFALDEAMKKCKPDELYAAHLYPLLDDVVSRFIKETQRHHHLYKLKHKIKSLLSALKSKIRD